MKDKISDELSKTLLESGELEGGLFAEISLSYCGRHYVARRDLYTVKDGLVYSVSTKYGNLFATGDSLWGLKRDCHRIGRYDSSKNYKMVATVFSYSEIKKKLKLKPHSKMKKAINIIIFILIAVLVAIPLIFLMQHPETTTGQLWYKFWHLYIGAISLGVLHILINPIESEL